MARNGTKSEITPPITVESRPGPGPWEAQLRKGAVEMAALAALWNGRLYGLEIIRFLEQHSQLVLAEGTVYPILNRLKAEAMLASEWVEADAGHPRKYYSLTNAGRQRLRLMAAAWTDFARGVDNLLQPVLTQPITMQQEQAK
jgi:PadR family transcriptional regulator PadR